MILSCYKLQAEPNTMYVYQNVISAHNDEYKYNKI